MYCKYCGKEIDEDVNFCPHCGKSQQGEPQPVAPSEPNRATVAVAEDKPPKVWTVFSIVGKVLGIVCLCASIVPYLNYFSLMFAIVGIVMSCLGRKAKTEETDRNCSIGLILSIIAVALSVIMIIVYLFLLVELII